MVIKKRICRFCRSERVFLRIIRQKNKSLHIQLYCKKCHKTSFVQKESVKGTEFYEALNKKKFTGRERPLWNHKPLVHPSVEPSDRQLKMLVKRGFKSASNAFKIRSKFPDSDPFFKSYQWQRLKLVVLQDYGNKCMKCHTKDAVMHVDHIKPRSKFPELELRYDNMQVLCEKCNFEKSNLHEEDYRPTKSQ